MGNIREITTRPLLITIQRTSQMPRWSTATATSQPGEPADNTPPRMAQMIKARMFDRKPGK
jgi:hypothetical protein